MIGDSDFIRDDLLRGDYRQVGGPNSLLGGGFFVQLLDWLAEDPDLLALLSRAAPDRTLHFVGTEETVGADPRLTEQAVRRKTVLLRGINIGVPAVVLGLFGLFVWLVRRTQKRSFLSSQAG
jgi:hypothetical protein